MKNNRRDFLKLAGLAGLSLGTANALWTQNLEDEKKFENLPSRIEIELRCPAGGPHFVHDGLPRNQHAHRQKCETGNRQYDRTFGRR